MIFFLTRVLTSNTEQVHRVCEMDKKQYNVGHAEPSLRKGVKLQKLSCKEMKWYLMLAIDRWQKSKIFVRQMTKNTLMVYRQQLQRVYLQQLYYYSRLSNFLQVSVTQQMETMSKESSRIGTKKNLGNWTIHLLDELMDSTAQKAFQRKDFHHFLPARAQIGWQAPTPTANHVLIRDDRFG